MSETVEDIVREIKTLANIDKESDEKISRKHMASALSGYAHRIEEAVKALEADRDNWRKQALDEDARANATCKESLQVGNAATMREVMIKADMVLSQTSNGYHSSVRQEIKAALSAPPRNCDLYATPKEAGEAFISESCENPCGNCTVSDECHNPLIHECGINWLFAEAKGETK